jgi:tRNA1Val (adenine37-N6)-methyltransferase
MDCQFISLEEFEPAEQFEMIVCNPPFFLDHLESPESGRNVSKHRTVHDLRNWLVRLEKLCITQGRIWLMLNPDSYAKTAQVLSDLGLSVTTNLVLSQSGNRIWRNILCLEKKVNPLSETLEQPVYEEGMNLHPVVKNWLKDYYLK